MNGLDWGIMAVYLLGLIGMSAWLGRRQRTPEDYYVAGKGMGRWPIAISTMATQCSTNSLLGAPAFVIAVGGLLWLQYELVLPLAMIAIMVCLLPFFRAQNVISIYAYLERRLGPASRTLLSVLFQLLRAFSTGVTVYGMALILQQLLGLPFWFAALTVGLVTILYDFLGGIRADIYSDVIQMVVLYIGIVLCLIYAVDLTGGWAAVLAAFPADKTATLDFGGFGLTDGRTYAFWPMVIGGAFLYISYYGCDQTQVQRSLSARSLDEANMALFLNGMLRFPLVLTYCLVGVAIGAYMVTHPEFAAALADPRTGETNYNLAVPVFCLQELPHGVIGLIMVALFAAAMSSLDSTINSLSAVTVHDVIERWIVRGPLAPARALLWARLTTVMWGAICIAFSFVVGRISASIIETINVIGSFANGPILATFLLATLTRRAHDWGVVIGIVAGFAANTFAWAFLPGMSWLWWNVTGCIVTFGVGYGVSLVLPGRRPVAVAAAPPDGHAAGPFTDRRKWWPYYLVLAVYFLVLIAVLARLHRLFGN